MLASPTLSLIKKAYSRKGYVYFSGSKPYNVNLWGIRKRYGQIDFFDDYLGICYTDEFGKEKIYCHMATVDPGKYYLLTKKGHPNGTFILAPGQYRGCWKTGFHGKSRYEALVQKEGYGQFRGWRDNVLDGKIQRRLDEGGEFFTDVTGLNMHRSNTSFSALVGQYSAGCQVRKYYNSHIAIMAILNKAKEYFSDSFSYTLFDEEDVFPNVRTRVLVTGKTSREPVWPDDFIEIQQ